MHGFITLSEAASYDKIIAYKAKESIMSFTFQLLCFPFQLWINYI